MVSTTMRSHRPAPALWLASAGLAVLVGLAPPRDARATFIPYGSPDYFELAGIGVTSTISGETLYASHLTGTSPDLAETVSDSYTIYGGDPPVAAGTVHAFARTTAGTAVAPPSVEMSANSLQAYFDDADVQATASVAYEATLIKLHPDAPDDIPIPLTFTSSLSGVARLTIGSEGTTLVDERALGGSVDIESGFSLLAFQGIGVDVRASTGGLLFGNEDLSGSGTAPVFAIDPDFRVPFGTESDPGRTERAVDLYTLVYPAAIGYAGSFQTATPLDDGCLPDPGLLAPDGSFAVPSGTAVTCRKVDPSGFRTYGNALGDPGGVIGDLQIEVEEGATVQTNVDGNVDPDAAATFGLLGDGSTLTNRGEIHALGESSNAVFVGGDGFDLVNHGRIDTQGDESEVVWIVGDEAGVVNQGTIASQGLLSSAVVVEGDGAFVSNDGAIETSGQASSGVVVEGDFATFESSGSIDTDGDFAAGVVVLGNDSVGSLENGGSITTQGDDAWGMVVLGQRHDIVNSGPTGGGGGHITTSGARAHGIALGLQEVTLPPGVGLPPGALAPASGSVTNGGDVETSGDEADAIHARADDLPVTNTGHLATSGTEAHGVSVEGEHAVVTNEGDVTASGDDSTALQVIGSDGVVESSGTLAAGDPAGGAAGAHGNRGIDATGDRTRVSNTGVIAVDSNGGIGIRVEGDAAVVSSGGSGAEIGVTGDSVEAIHVASDVPVVVNEGTIRASGGDAVGLWASAGGGAGFQVTSSGDVAVDGVGARGMVLSGTLATGAAPAGAPTPACVVLGDGTGKLVNCGSITFQDSDFGAGMEATGIHDATVENQGQLVGGGQGARGISVASAAGAAGERNNLISNVDRIDVTGPNAVGIEVSGDDNVVLQGNGLIAIPLAPFEDPKDLQDVFGRELFPNAESIENEFSTDTPSGTTLPIGRVVVTGTSAIGVSISGDRNRVGQVFSGQADASTIEARGAGAVGVKLEGDGNLFVNLGDVIGDGTGILGGSGRDSVANLNRVEGGIDLGAGADRLLVDAGSQIVGTANGGADVDELVFFVPDGDSHGIDGDQYQDFEDLWKIGAGELVLSNTLRGNELLLEVGELNVAPGARLETSASSIHVRDAGRLSGSGTAAGTLRVEGGTLAPGSGVGGVGTLTVEGDLVFESGVLEIQLGGSGPGQSDLLDVLGSASFLDGDLLVSFADGFLPTLGEAVDFLVADEVTGLANLDVDVAGLPAGYAFDLAATASGVRLVTSSVPEPSIGALVALGLAGMGLARRRRARRAGHPAR